MFCSFSILEFFVVNMNFARIFASISLVFLLKMRPYFARIFTKMSPYEELGTLLKTKCRPFEQFGPHAKCAMVDWIYGTQSPKLF